MRNIYLVRWSDEDGSNYGYREFHNLEDARDYARFMLDFEADFVDLVDSKAKQYSF